VYSSPWNTLSMLSSSATRFFASSFSRFLFFLIHLRVSSSPSASPRVTPLSEALSSRRFLTLTRQVHEQPDSLRTERRKRDGSDRQGLERGYSLGYSILDLPEKSREACQRILRRERGGPGYFDSRCLISISRCFA
jgi:hypothetical protein